MSVRYETSSVSLALLVPAILLSTGCASTHPQPATPATMPAIPPASARPAAEIRPYPAEQVIGDTRVVLIRVSRCTSFSSNDLMANEPGRVYAIPEITVDYLVEYVGADPDNRGQQHVGTSEIYSDGRKALTHPDAIAGVTGVIMPYDRSERLPKVSNPKQAFLRRETWRGLLLTGQSVDVRLRAGFGELKEFVFRDVPLY